MGIPKTELAFFIGNYLHFSLGISKKHNHFFGHKGKDEGMGITNIFDCFWYKI